MDEHQRLSLMIPLNDRPATQAFLVQTPVIGVSDDKLTGIVFVRSNSLQSPQDLVQLHRDHYSGMDRLRLLVLGGAGDYPIVPDELTGCLTTEPAANFLERSQSPAKRLD